ncbi:MYND-type zinc finger protein MUB1 [Aspergillus puulaauensis]|uniref:MYND-type zinc finger protein samB n=1 Tax=Aspergillus puulaauensis TaxID=1220207 RepID=A0A7R8AIA7_9EURO|nr:uncharacterized protein APUU_12085S [Aspergillus puulaauensis]BCS19257.1 hypothetical protein APUU_12085S [Aspergillus puulaauensis]
MREVNFSIPNVNKASVNITTTLYDRRALDCTSTLPLINSLNHLAYLTTSSARIRDILTVDGGIERLICILKEGRSNNLMEMWKWSLAFQCVVNIGVRGSEIVRTRVVEADMVPVIATILDNYIKVIDKVRARSDSEAQRHKHQHYPHKTSPSTSDSASRPSLPDITNTEQRTSRRQPPPTHIEIPPFYHDTRAVDSNAMDVTSSPRVPVTSPPERSTFGQDAHAHRSHANPRHRAIQPLATAIPSMDTADGFGLRPVRDAERLPSMLPAIFNGLASQPDSPTTPNDHRHIRNNASTTQRPTLRQNQSTSGESDDATGEDAVMGDDTTSGDAAEPIIGVQSGMDLDDDGDRQTMIDSVSDSHDLTVTDTSEGQDAETFNITHRSTVDGSIINNDNAQAVNNANSPPIVPSPYSLYFRDRPNTASQNFLNTMPREEDVLMSLQLLAYVSKYCDLRSYFQSSHLVPKLKVDRELQMLDEGASPIEPLEEEDEYLLPDDVNIFPLVEKFTARHHSKDMSYWACVVMRNLCRKDESRGGIRQCAYYKCGKWEEFTRQFAKCRRCRRTKYCSKDCQKAAWLYHRHWCATP